MKAVGFFRNLPTEDEKSLVALEVAEPVLRPHDLLVRPAAVSVNPVDIKVRRRVPADRDLDEPKIAGYDAVGRVEALGPAAPAPSEGGFRVGDRVWYAGDVTRQGSNAERQAVDSRVVARAPERLSDPEAAALPLTGLTAWEALFHRLRIPLSLPSVRGEPRARGPKTLLVIAGAGGVGSMAIQLAKQCADLHLIATASRPESAAWCRALGADAVADHRDLVASVRALGQEHVDCIFNAADTVGYWDAMAELIAPQGGICGIVSSPEPVALSALMQKSASFSWEYMFTRPQFETSDIAAQGEILAHLAGLIERGRLRSTLRETLHGLSPETLRRAHAMLETGRTLGKIAIAYESDA